MERVVERAKIWIDLLVKRSWQETKALPRFNCGARQDNARNLFSLQRLNRFRYR